MPNVTHSGLLTVITATDLITGNALRFGSERSSCSRFGTIVGPVPVASAVAFWAAYPLFLPALKRSFVFERAGEFEQEHVVLLADGGIYDNLGLSVLDPDGRERLPITCMTCHASSRVMPEGVSSAHRHLGSS